jgi:cyclase
MLRPRVIPFLLVHRGGLVKTVRFRNPKYVGDPINTVRLFNEKQVDEICVLDIDATVESRPPDYKMIANLAAECRMPLCYGGGVRTAGEIERIVALGVEKVAISAAALTTPQLIVESARRVGSQSVVVVLDVKRSGLLRRYEVFTHNGTRGSGLDPVALAKQAEELGAGEVVVNSIDRDGEMAGYDLDLITKVREAIRVPLSVVGGAGSIEHLQELIRRFGIIGLGAGSLFVFKGKYRAVLVSYPTPAERDRLSNGEGVS